MLKDQKKNNRQNPMEIKQLEELGKKAKYE